MNRTLLDECFKVAGRQTWYIEPEEIQRDLDKSAPGSTRKGVLRYHNLDRTHQGYRLKGRTPAQALREALGIEEIPDVTMDLNMATEVELPEAA